MPFETFFFGRLKVKVTLEGHINYRSLKFVPKPCLVPSSYE